jgi:23S rRNA pseudouridine1911/1915/1917 synthase
MHTRSYVVNRAEGGRTLADWLHSRLALPRDAALRLVRGQCVRLNGTPCLDPGRRLHAGQRLEVRAPAGQHSAAGPGKRRKANPERADSARGFPGPAPVIRFADEHIVVVDKPAGLTTMRHEEEAAEFGKRARHFLPTTLADLLPGMLTPGPGGRPARVRAVHRLDKETSGLVVFARTGEAERDLGQQFRAHSTERVYLAAVRGRARAGRIESWLVRDRGDRRRGSSATPGEGQRAVTHVRVVEGLGDYTLVECRLETGRTHQVRIHLGEAGTPLCGDHVYDRPLHGRPLPDGSGAARIALHAATLGFDHPATGERVRWTAPPPPDLAGLVERLRRGRGPEPGP